MLQDSAIWSNRDVVVPEELQGVTQPPIGAVAEAIRSSTGQTRYAGTGKSGSSPKKSGWIKQARGESTTWLIWARMAWHDHGLDGRVCNDPVANSCCTGNHSLFSERLAREASHVQAGLCNDRCRAACISVALLLDFIDRLEPVHLRPFGTEC